MTDKYDGIVIGDTVSEQFMNNGTFNSEAIGKAYDLKYRTDLVGNQAKFNLGSSDTSSVFEVVTTFEQQLLVNGNAIETILNNAKDPLNSAISTIDVEHYEIHEGDHYFYSGVIAITNGATSNYVLEVGAKPIHFVFGVNGNDAGISGATYENVVSNNDGTIVIINNNNRMSSNTSTGILRLNPTGINTAPSILLREYRAGTGGAVSTRTSGSVNRQNEVIMKANTKYLIRITNLSTSTNNVSVDMSWYEL